MALYWPDHKVAVDIIDDPKRQQADVPDDWEVLEVTCAQLEDPVSCQKFMRKVGERLGCDMSFTDDPSWQQRNLELHRTLMDDIML